MASSLAMASSIVRTNPHDGSTSSGHRYCIFVSVRGRYARHPQLSRLSEAGVLTDRSPTRQLTTLCWGRFEMTYGEFNAFCRALPATTHVIQWGGSHVWKVGGKVFAIGGWGDGEARFTFKAGDIAYEMLKDQPGLRPAPYLASRGMNMNPALRRAGPFRRRAAGLPTPLPPHRLARPAEETTTGVGAQSAIVINPTPG